MDGEHGSANNREEGLGQLGSGDEPSSESGSPSLKGEDMVSELTVPQPVSVPR